MHQQKQNVISIGKYCKVFQPFKMKQNLSLQTVSSSHCSSLTCLFQGKQILFHLKWLMLIPARNQPFPTAHSELGEDLVVIKNLLAVFVPASPNRKFPALFVRWTSQLSILFWVTPGSSSQATASDGARAASSKVRPSLHLNFGLLAAKYQCWSQPHGKRHPAKVFCTGT